MNSLKLLSVLAIIAAAILAITIYPLLYLVFGREKQVKTN
jgi:O-antigen/teichoic acid export membrane protein